MDGSDLLDHTLMERCLVINPSSGGVRPERRSAMLSSAAPVANG